jgi:hypothetical protein
MEPISYDEFGKLRIKDYFPRGTRLFFDDSASTECAIGLACTEGMAFTYFAWRPEEPRKIAEVALDFREECPSSVATLVFESIRMPLAAGMSLAELERLLGVPEFSDLNEDGEAWCGSLSGSNGHIALYAL